MQKILIGLILKIKLEVLHKDGAKYTSKTITNAISQQHFQSK